MSPPNPPTADASQPLPSPPFYSVGVVVALAAGMVIYLISVPLHATVLQVPLGLVALLFAPGYGLGAILFRRTARWSWTVLFPISVGLSALVNVFTGIVLVTLRAGLPPAVFGLVALIALAGGALVLEWERIGPPRGRPTITPATFATPVALIATELSLPGFDSRQRAAAFALLAAIVVVLAALGFLAALPHPGSGPTVSLSITGPGGNVTQLPTRGTTNQTLDVFVTVRNNGTSQLFRLIASSVVNGSRPGPSPIPWQNPLPLGNGVQATDLLVVASEQTSTLEVGFYFPAAAQYLLTFTLTDSSGSSLRTTAFSVTIA